MDEVTMDDGLDRPESLVAGLGVAETGALVVALLAGWACVAALPAAVGWPGAVILAGSGALLGWGRVDDRTLLAWAVLAARFGWRRRGRAAAAVNRRGRAAIAPLVGRTRGTRASARAGARGGGAGTVVVPLVLPRLAAPPARGGARVVGFFSLRGGSGRTSLACAVAARLAAGGRLPGRQGWRLLRVVLLDLDTTLPAASLRWGATIGGPPRRHASGAVIHPAPLDAGGDPVGALGEVATEADVVVVDARWQGPGGADLLRRCDDIVVLTAPAPAGLLDAYRSVAWLRRVGLRDRLVLVATHCDDAAELGELEGDLGLAVVARVPVTDDIDGEPAVESLAALLNRRLLAGRTGDDHGDAIDAEAG